MASRLMDVPYATCRQLEHAAICRLPHFMTLDACLPYSKLVSNLIGALQVKELTPACILLENFFFGNETLRWGLKNFGMISDVLGVSQFLHFC
jgi:hypothetical protein